MPTTPSNIAALIQDFADRLVAVANAAALDRLRAALHDALTAPAELRPARPLAATPVAVAHGPAPASGARKPAKRTAALVRSRKLQGQYLGPLRGLGPADGSKVQAIAKEKGVAEALKLAVSFKE